MDLTPPNPTSIVIQSSSDVINETQSLGHQHKDSFNNSKTTLAYSRATPCNNNEEAVDFLQGKSILY